jgi:hypothetical protein
MRLVSALIAAAACVAAIGCGLNQEGIGPPNNQIFYPGAIRVDPTNGRWLYVVNSNSDLRYNDGTLVAVDLDAVNADRKLDNAWGNCPSVNYIYPSSSPAKPPANGPQTTSAYCCWDTLDSNVLNCDERGYIKSAVKIGSFGSAIEIQPPDPTPDVRIRPDPDNKKKMYKIDPRPATQKSRLFMGVRGNASITWVDADATVDPPTFDCTGDTNPDDFVECNLDHRVVDEPNPNNANPVPVLPDEPYALAIDSPAPVPDPDPAKSFADQQPLFFVGHLRGGFLSAIDVTATPTLLGSFGTIFPGDVNGSLGVTSLTVTTSGVNTGHIFATSRFLPRAGAFIPISSSGRNVNPYPDPTVFLANAGDGFVSPLAGSEIRGIQVIPGINRTYLLQRTPPALVGFDTLGGQNVATDVVEMCQGPTFLHMSPPYRPSIIATGATDTDTDKRLFVSCFEAGEVYVVDPYVPQIISIIEVGRGPAGLAFSDEQPAPSYAYVVGFGANNVSVIDLRPGDTQYHVIQRIGFPSPVPR